MLGTSPAATACQQRRHRRRSAIARRRHIPAASAMGCAESVLWKAALRPSGPRRRHWRDALQAPLTLIFHGSIGAYRRDGQVWTTGREHRTGTHEEAT